MSSQIEDRRVRRTRQLLENALVTLILQKGYENVTVQDILDEADLGRSTFYAHYRDKEELLYSRFNRLREALDAHNRGIVRGKGQSGYANNSLPLALFQQAERDRPLFRALLGKQSRAMLLNHMQEYLSAHMEEHLRLVVLDEKNPPVSLDALAHYYTSGLLALLVWWLDNDSSYTVGQMESLFHLLVVPGFSKVLGFHLDAGG